MKKKDFKKAVKEMANENYKEFALALIDLEVSSGAKLRSFNREKVVDDFMDSNATTIFGLLNYFDDDTMPTISRIETIIYTCSENGILDTVIPFTNEIDLNNFLNSLNILNDKQKKELLENDYFACYGLEIRLSYSSLNNQ